MAAGIRFGRNGSLTSRSLICIQRQLGLASREPLNHVLMVLDKSPTRINSMTTHAGGLLLKVMR